MKSSWIRGWVGMLQKAGAALLVKALSKTHLGALKASLVLSQHPKFIASVQLHFCSLARTYGLTWIWHIFRWGDWQRAFNKDVWEKLLGRKC